MKRDYSTPDILVQAIQLQSVIAASNVENNGTPGNSPWSNF